MATATMTTTKTTPSTWADSPFPLLATPLGSTPLSAAHGALHSAQGMSHIHNMILRGLNAIYNQAPYVKETQDIKDLLKFVTIWHDNLLHHHDTEEKKYFPDLEELTGISMEGNVAQHKAFEESLDNLGTWAKKTTPLTFNAIELHTLLDTLGPILQEHLADEIATLLALRDFDSAKIKKIWIDAGNYAKRSSPLTEAVPYMIGTYDVTFEGKAVSDIEMPWIVSLLNGWVLNRKYAGAWRFLPCDWSGKPRKLTFGPKE